MTQVHDCCPSRQGIGKGDRKSRSEFPHESGRHRRDWTNLIRRRVPTRSARCLFEKVVLRDEFAFCGLIRYLAVMVRWLGILVGTLRSCLRTHRDLALENLALRQQLAVWKARERRPRLTEMDRIFWVFLSTESRVIQ